MIYLRHLHQYHHPQAYKICQVPGYSQLRKEGFCCVSDLSSLDSAPHHPCCGGAPLVAGGAVRPRKYIDKRWEKLRHKESITG